MTTETTPGSVQTLDNLRICFVPTGANPLSAAILNGGTAKLLTYSLQPDGFDFPMEESEIPDNRLTSSLQGTKPGATKFGPIKLKYVFGSASDVARLALAPSTQGSLVIRDTLANSVDFAVGQKVDLLTFAAGKQRKFYTGDLQTIMQALHVDAGSYKPDQTLIA